jgi:hypothetical protein
MLSVAVPAWAASTTLVIFPVIRSVESAPEGKKTTVSVDKLVRIVASRERRESLEAIQLPAESLVGRSRLSKQSIVDLLEAQPEIAGSEIVGPDWITVVAPGHAKTQSKVISEARVALQDHVKSQWPDLYRNIKPVYRGQIERLPVGLDSVWSFDFSDITYLGRRTPVWLVVSTAQKTERTVLWFEVSGEQFVWQASRSMAVKATAHEKNFLQQWVSLSEIKYHDLATPTPDERITVALEPGDLLTKRHLELIPDVEFGDEAVVISKVGDVEIRATDTVTRTAFVGDLIEMQSKSSNENFQVRVLERNLVQIDSSMQ